MDNTNKTNPGILCSVEQCAYHTQNDMCTADKIKVGACQTSCCSSCDTECATFKPRG